MEHSSGTSRPNSPRKVVRSSQRRTEEAASLGLTLSLYRIVRNRFPRLSSSEDVQSPASSSDNDFVPLSRRTSSQSTLVGTPGLGYRSRASLCASETECDTIDESLNAGSDELGPVDSLALDELGDERENESGIDWKIANHGLRLLNLSTQESHAFDEDNRRNIPSLTRQLYIHGVTYGIRGLPSDLTNDEILGISAALPASVRHAIAISASPSAAKHQYPSRDRSFYPSQRATQQPPSAIHRIIAAFILQLCLLIQFLAPYLRRFVVSVAVIEREHQITERLLRGGVRGTDALIRLGNRICELDEGRVGEHLEAVVVWWIRGIAGGVRQGLGDGLVALGGENQSSAHFISSS